MLRRSLRELQAGDPTRIGAYSVVGRLGAGAMGQVYLARSPSSRLVAVKTIRADLADDADFRRRFAHEVSAARRVSGAFTAPVVDADPDATIPWLATTYVSAPSLATLVDTCGPLPVAAVRWLAAGCAEALESIHRCGLIHRDFKPANLLVAADGPKVIDFGLAHTDGLPHQTRVGHVMGTPAYMAPEQATGSESIGPAADVFSLGATLVFAATGHPPYRANSGTEVILLLSTEEPDLTGVPDSLRGILESCMAWDPADRPTPAGLIDLLAPFLSGTSTAAPLPGDALRVIDDYRRARHPGSTPSEGGQQPTPFATAEPFAGASLNRRSLPRSTAPSGWWKGAALAGVAGLIGAAVFAGWALGRNGGAPAAAVQTSQTSQTVDGGRQAGGLPGGPPLGVQQGGPMTLVVTQPLGDVHTNFVIHGGGWPPGRRVTISIVGGKTSPDRPVVDDGGNFNYALNQNHELFDGDLPAGTLTVRAASGPNVREVLVQVNPSGLAALP